MNDDDLRGKNIINVLNFAFWILEIIIFAVSIFLQVRVKYADTNNQLLKTISNILWIAGFVLCAAAVVTAVILQVRQGKIIQKYILIALFVCTAVLACYVKTKVLFVFPNGGDWKVVGKERDFMGYRLQVRTTSPYTDTEAYIYCTEKEYKELATNRIYNIYFTQNPYFPLAILENYGSADEK